MSDSPFLRSRREPPPKPSAPARAAAKKSATDVRSRARRPDAAAAPRTATARLAELQAAMLADLARSGLTAEDAKIMRLHVHEAGTLDLHPSAAGYSIPYFWSNGEVRSDLYRYRFLEDTRRKGFARLGGHKVRRYTQPAKTPPGVYWPPFTAWEQISTQSDVPIVITEGEKKAAACTKAGVPCIGLGGVWSFRSKSLGTKLLGELVGVTWTGRRVFIAYDSDAALNRDICAAESALATELLERGAMVKIVRLPELVEGEKCGLDDYLLAEGAERFVTLCDNAEPFSFSDALHRMNAEVVYVQEPGIICVRKTMQLCRAADFANHRFADRRYTRTVTAPNGSTKLETRSTAADWLKWPQRAVTTKLVYAPGHDEVTPNREYNLWRGWPYEPAKGDVSPWTNLLDFLFDGAPEIRRWFEQWAAYPIQNPGAKLRNAVGIWGRRKGTGKSLAGYLLGDLYGDAFYEIGDSHVAGRSDHNEWAKNRQFVLGDEITGDDSRGVANRLKNMITRERVEINSKHVPQYTLVDCINYYFTANAPDCFYLEEDDRRILIHEVRGTPRPREFYQRIDAWRRSRTGPAALMWHLMYAVDTSDFDPMERPPETRDKREMIQYTRTELEDWVQQLRDHPELITDKFGGSDLVSVAELVTLYEAAGYKRASGVLISRKLKEAGLDPLYPSDNPETNQFFAAGKLVRLYALRNGAKWAKAATAELRAHFEKCRGYRGDVRKKF